MTTENIFKVAVYKLSTAVVGFALAINVNAQTVDGSQATSANVNRLVAFQEFFKAKMGGVRKSCELDRTRFVVDDGKKWIAKAESARTKTEQAEMKKFGEITILQAPFIGRFLCLTQFYRTLYSAYGLTSIDSYRYREIELMLTDDLTDKKMQAVANSMSLTHQKWLQVVQAQPRQDLMKMLNGGKQVSATAENYIDMQADQELRSLLGMFLDDAFPNPERFGCTVTPDTVTCD